MKNWKAKGGNYAHIKGGSGKRSTFEIEVDENLQLLGVEADYEKNTIEYVVPESKHKYTPDFKLPNGIYIESKGWLTSDDRKKHIYIKKQHPEIDIRFVFQSPGGKIYKGSKTTYSQWADKNGFKWAKKYVPKEWIEEAPRQTFFG